MVKYIGGSLFLLGILIVFQNCSKKSFSTRVDPSSQSLLSIDSSGGSTTTTDPKNIDDDIVTTPPPEPVSFTGCRSFQELVGTTITVPAQNGDGVCYYVRLMSASSSHASGSRGEALAEDVVARPHARPDNNPRPYILGQKQISQLQLLGKRNVALSGSFSNAQASMFIDNFFLVEQVTEVGSYRAWAYGTADAEPSGGKITVNNFAVEDFYAYARGGTATVAAIDMTAAIPSGLKMSLHFRGLDCGVAAVASDVFMVFH